MLTYLLAVLAACANAVSSVLQRKANREMPSEDSLRLRLILKLLRRPVWFAGVAAVIVGFLLQAAALGSGELSVVEPILVFELPLTLVLASGVFRTSLRLQEWAAALGMTAGLAGLLYFLAPSPASPSEVNWYVWLLGVGANLAVVAAAVEWGRRAPAGPDRQTGSSRRAAAFGAAAGCQFGLTAALIKGMTERYDQGFGAVFTGWELYGMIASGALSMFLLQSAMQAGCLIAAQPGLTLSDPLVSILWGVFAFGEQVRGGWYAVAAASAGAVLAVSVLVLARSPLLDEENTTETGRPRAPAAPATADRDGR